MLVCLISLIQCFLQTMSFASIDVEPEKTWKSIQQVEYSNEINHKDVSLFIPQNLPDSIENKDVGKKVMDHTLSNFVSGEMTPDAKIFQKVKEVEEKVKLDVEIPKKHVDDISHKFKFHYRPFQNKLECKYKGFFKANIEYNLRDSFLIYTIEKDLGKNTLLALAQTDDPYSDNRDSLTTLNFKMQWN